MSLSAIINPLDHSTYLIFYLDSNSNVAFTSSSAVSPTKIDSSNQVNANNDKSVAVGNMVKNTALTALYLNNMINVYGFYNGTPGVTGKTEPGPNALTQMVPGFVNLVSDATLVPKAQLAGCTNSDNSEGILYYVTVGGNLTSFHLLDQDPVTIASNVEVTSNLAAAWGAIGDHDATPHVAYQVDTPGEDGIYDLVVMNTDTRATVTIVADSMFPAPISIVFANKVMYVYYFSATHVLKRAVYDKFNDSNSKVTSLTAAPKLNVATTMTAVVNAPKGNNPSTITLYYIGKDNKLVGYEDNLE